MEYVYPSISSAHISLDPVGSVIGIPVFGWDGVANNSDSNPSQDASPDSRPPVTEQRVREFERERCDAPSCIHKALTAESPEEIAAAWERDLARAARFAEAHPDIVNGTAPQERDNPLGNVSNPIHLRIAHELAAFTLRHGRLSNLSGLYVDDIAEVI